MAEEDIERVEALDPLKASRIQNPDKVRDELGAPIWEEVKRSAYPPLKRIDLLRLADRPPHSVSLEAREQFAVVTDWTKNDQDPFGDGDQSTYPGSASIPGGAAYPVVEAWCDAPELNILFSQHSHRRDKLRLTTHFGIACIYGLVDEVRGALTSEGGVEEGKDERLRELLNERHLSLRMTPLMFVIAGARVVGERISEAPCANHLETARLLISAGADINARDVAGYSCIFHCTTNACNRHTLAIAQLMLATGRCRVNVPCRLGKTPLEDCLLYPQPNTMVAAALLLEAGADSTVSFMSLMNKSDIPGECTALQMVSAGLCGQRTWLN